MNARTPLLPRDVMKPSQGGARCLIGDRYVRQSGELSLAQRHHALKKAVAIEWVFRYQSLHEPVRAVLATAQTHVTFDLS
jgi:hypothetical protein